MTKYNNKMSAIINAKFIISQRVVNITGRPMSTRLIIPGSRSFFSSVQMPVLTQKYLFFSTGLTASSCPHFYHNLRSKINFLSFR